MASANVGTSETSPSHKTRWYIPMPARFLVFVLLMQGVLFLSAYYRWFGFNERKGFTVLIAVAATAGLLLLLGVWIAISRFFRTKMQFGLATFC